MVQKPMIERVETIVLAHGVAKEENIKIKEMC